VVIELPKGGYVPVIRTTPPAFIPVRRDPYRLWSGIGIGLIILLCAILGWTRFGPARRRGTGNAQQAYTLYLRARAFEMRPAVKGVEESIDLFEQAIARDPSFAPAYAGIAAGQATRSAFDRFDLIERRDIIAKGWAAAEKAIQLNARSADSQDALGMMQARQAQWEQARQSFQRAIGIAPSDPLWRDHFAFFFLLPLGRTEEALRQLRIAEELDPLSHLTHNALSLALRSAGRFEEAEFHCKTSAENDRQSSGCWAETLLRQGNAGQAIRILEETWSGRLLEMGAESLGVAYAHAGRLEDAARIAAIVPRPASKAAIFAALADKDLTFAMLDKMVPMGPTRVGRDVLINRDFAFLRGDLRLKTLRRKVGLPE
jgi:tetratricopeptide (TPR) repeat protein